MSYEYQTVMSFLSSSEHNRCRRNGLYIYQANNWFEVIKYPWLTRKLRRKIGHLWNCNLLKELPRTPIIGIRQEQPELYAYFSTELAKQYLAIEDHYILTGEIKSQI